MGYAQTAETGRGIHMRLRSRAFIVSETKEKLHHSTGGSPSPNGEIAPVQTIERLSLRWSPRDEEKHYSSKARVLADAEKTVCFVSADFGMGSDLLNMKVVKRLEELLPPQDGSDKPLCHLENLSIRYVTREIRDHDPRCFSPYPFHFLFLPPVERIPIQDPGDFCSTFFIR